jgi:hypothetical protein
MRIRPNTTDVGLIFGHVAGGQHLPLRPIADQPLRQICEFGTNIGLGLADLALRYPDAHLLGVEAHPTNANLARINLARFRDRCELVEAAVWDANGEVILEGDQPGLIFSRADDEPAPGAMRARAVTPQKLLEEHMPDGMIDYLHLDMVESEPRILEPGTDWIGRVRSLKVQLYEGHEFTPARCLNLLRDLGFEVVSDMGPHGPFAFGFRPAAPSPAPVARPAGTRARLLQ